MYRKPPPIPAIQYTVMMSIIKVKKNEQEPKQNALDQTYYLAQLLLISLKHQMCFMCYTTPLGISNDIHCIASPTSTPYCIAVSLWTCIHSFELINNKQERPHCLSQVPWINPNVCNNLCRHIFLTEIIPACRLFMITFNRNGVFKSPKTCLIFYIHHKESEIKAEYLCSIVE